MSDTRRALDAFSNAVRISEESPALTQARQDYQSNPEDENLKNRYSQLSIPAGYPDIHDAAVNFQNALMSTSKMGHTRGWQGGEEELDNLQQTAQAHGIDPGLFITPEGAGGSKREHALHLTRLYGGKFLPGDGRSGMWEPMAHSFPDEQSAQGFTGAMQQYYPETPLQPQAVPTQVEQPGPDGQPVPSQEMVYNIALSHDDLGDPFPPGSKQFATMSAQQRSAAAPHPHHVVVDQQGEHGVSLNPDPESQQIVQTFVKGEPMQAVPQEGPPEEEQPEEEEEPEEPEGEEDGRPPEAPQDNQADMGPQGAQGNVAPQQTLAPQESMDNIDRLLNDLGINNTATPRQSVVQENIMGNDLSEILGLYQNSNRQSPSLLMNETVSVDSNRGVTSRGNSPHDKYVSPATREKVLKSRLDEIQAFARSRSIPLAGVLGAAEVAMRTGKAPDMGQYGMNGDDAVATKQFIISNILNIQGLEDVNYDGESLSESESIDETHGLSGRHGLSTTMMARVPPTPDEILSPDALKYMKGKGKVPKRERLGEGAKGKHQHGFDPRERRKFSGADLGSRSNYMPVEKSLNKRREREMQVDRDRRPVGLGSDDKAGRPSDHPEEAKLRARELGPAAVTQQKASWAAGKPCPVTGCPAPRSYQAESVKGKPQHGQTAERLRRFMGKGPGQSDLRRDSMQQASKKRNKQQRRGDDLVDTSQDRTPTSDGVARSIRRDDAEDAEFRRDRRDRHLAALKNGKSKWNPRGRGGSRHGKQSVNNRFGVDGRYDQIDRRDDKEEGVEEAFNFTPLIGSVLRNNRLASQRREMDRRHSDEESRRRQPSQPQPSAPAPGWGSPEGKSLERDWKSSSLASEKSSQESMVKREREAQQARQDAIAKRAQDKKGKRDRNRAAGNEIRAKREAAKAARARAMNIPREPRMDGVNFDPSRYMSEEGAMRSQEHGRAGNASPGPGAPPMVGDLRQVDLLPKKVMKQLKKEIGDAVYGYSREELFSVARERGLLGTEESAAWNAAGNPEIVESRQRIGSGLNLDSEFERLLQRSPGKSLGGADLREGKESSLTEHDYQAVAKKHGGKYLGYVQPHQAMYEFKNAKSAQKFANLMAAKTSSTPTVTGKRVSIDEPTLGEMGHLGYAGHAGPGGPDSPHGMPGPTKAPLLGDEKGPKKKRGKAKVEERSFTDRILGIEKGDPRGDVWPKMSDDVKKLLNLESNMSLSPRGGFHMEKPPAPVQEATFGTSMGGFIGGGMQAFDLPRRTTQLPPYDASVDLEGSEEDKKRKYQALLRNLGLSGE